MKPKDLAERARALLVSFEKAFEESNGNQTPPKFATESMPQRQAHESDAQFEKRLYAWQYETFNNISNLIAALRHYYDAIGLAAHWDWSCMEYQINEYYKIDKREEETEK